MKFYALLCGLIAVVLILAPAIAMSGSDQEKKSAVSDADTRQTSETAMEWVTENISAADE